jgi:hypothetical protein
MPVIGYLDLGTFDKARDRFMHVQRGLSETGYVEALDTTLDRKNQGSMATGKSASG